MKDFRQHSIVNVNRSPRMIQTFFMAILMVFMVGCSAGGTSSAGTSSGGGETAAASESLTAEPGTAEQEKTASVEESVSIEAEAAGDASAADGISAECPENVVAVSKSIAELWLLSGGSLAGTTEDAMELEGISEETAVIGTLSRPNNEAVLALSPELVLLTEDIPAQKELKTQLEGMGIATMSIEINSFEDYLACMGELTDLTGRKDLYEENAAAVGERIDAIREQAKAEQGAAGDADSTESSLADPGQSADDAGRKTFLAMRVSATKNKVFKDDYFACEIFRDFGLVNIAEGDSNLDELNLEAIVAADPDYIFVIPQGKESEAMESFRTQFEENPVWSELGAVKSERLFILPKDYFQYKPNAKWDLAYEYIRDLLQES